MSWVGKFKSLFFECSYGYFYAKVQKQFIWPVLEWDESACQVPVSFFLSSQPII